VDVSKGRVTNRWDACCLRGVGVRDVQVSFAARLCRARNEKVGRKHEHVLCGVVACSQAFGKHAREEPDTVRILAMPRALVAKEFNHARPTRLHEWKNSQTNHFSGLSRMLHHASVGMVPRAIYEANAAVATLHSREGPEISRAVVVAGNHFNRSYIGQFMEGRKRKFDVICTGMPRVEDVTCVDYQMRLEVACDVDDFGEDLLVVGPARDPANFSTKMPVADVEQAH
jgi:hypothetical protein